MSALRAAYDLEISSGVARQTDVRDVGTERAPDPVPRSGSGTEAEGRTLIRARITEVLDSQQTELDGDYHFERLPMPNDQVIILNRRRSYDIFKVLHSTRGPRTGVYVRWVARR
jgi:hypothetical protein